MMRDRLVERTKPETRRLAGIYYTPPFIVRHIVDTTLGRLLDGLIEEHGMWAIERARGIRVLDPACGSGSFLIQAYDAFASFYRRLNAQIDTEFLRLTVGVSDAFDQADRTRHLPRPIGDYPRVILTAHLYGVDIDAEAAEIATLNVVMRAFRELRSLGRTDDKLPLILNQNIKVGNSLLAPFGADLPEYAAVRQDALADLIQLRAELAATQSDTERTQLLTRLSNRAAPTAAEAADLSARSVTDVSQPFDWFAEFPEVWVSETGEPLADPGFRVVIGNPPYVRIQRIATVVPLEATTYREIYVAARRGNYDTYVLFLERGLQLLRSDGELGFIVPHRFFTAQYGQPLRGLLTAGAHVERLVHFGAEQVFAGATTYTALIFLSKAAREDLLFKQVRDLAEWRDTGMGAERRLRAADLDAREWNIAVEADADLFERLRECPLKLGDIADIFVGLQTSADDVYIMEYVSRTHAGIVLRSPALARDWEFEVEAVHPLVSGTDVSPFGPLPSRQYILFPYTVESERATLMPFSDLAARWPMSAEYLLRNRERLEARETGRFRGDQWYRFGRHQNLGIQTRVKLCVPRLVKQLTATLDADGTHFLDNVDVNGISMKADYRGQRLEYIAALLNSKLLRWFFARISVLFRGNYLSANKQHLAPLPIRTIDSAAAHNETMEARIVDLVNRIAVSHREMQEAADEEQRRAIQLVIDTYQMEIDNLVFEIYGLTPSDVQTHCRLLCNVTGLPHRGS